MRFCVNMEATAGRKEWVARCREAEELGMDVIATPDHLGITAPFPPLVLAAEVTERVRLTTLTLNAAFYNPTLLARDVVSVDVCTDGRFELGLGTGYAKPEFDKAGIPFERPGARVDHLVRTLDELDRYYADPKEPNPVQQPGPPVLIGGEGDRMLRLAARRADIIAFPGAGIDENGLHLREPEQLLERTQFARKALDGREAELNLLVQHVEVTKDSAGAYERLAKKFRGAYSAEQLTRYPIFLIGSAEHIAEELRAHGEHYGITYFSVSHTSMIELAKVLPLLR